MTNPCVKSQKLQNIRNGNANFTVTDEGWKMKKERTTREIEG